jgi:hypothetical protein
MDRVHCWLSLYKEAKDTRAFDVSPAIHSLSLFLSTVVADPASSTTPKLIKIFLCNAATRGNCSFYDTKINKNISMQSNRLLPLVVTAPFTTPELRNSVIAAKRLSADYRNYQKLFPLPNRRICSTTLFILV